MTKRIIAVLVGFVCLTSIGCEEEDLTAPTIELSSPTTDQVFTIDEKILMVGRAADDDALSYFNIESDLGTLDGAEITDFDDPTDFPFNLEICIDPNTPTGNYFLKVIARDVAQNESELTRNIVIE